ncbi:DNA adenine methylase [Anaerosporobacter sp.]|uniref:DNA adenine methylase n=1 Tax=Anaerosporobacter sp. TaxID=1872529 RepID=UPI00286FA289|nr:DNA adenine methylase [Anaerosporobacter sp.]
MSLKGLVIQMERVLKYPGSKWNLVPHILPMIPKHHTYLEPYFGSGAILFSKEPSDIEMINDLDGNVVNLFNCIREDPERLARMVLATPFSREVYDETYETQHDEAFEKALQFLTKCWQGYGFRTNGSKVGWKNDVQGRESMYALWDWYKLPDKILQIAERLRKVQIENRPALEVMKRFDYENVFMYLDPPYVLDTRTGEQYLYEMSDEEHEELLIFSVESKAKIMISGYESDLYNEYLKGWNKEQFNSCAEMGAKRIETVWYNYEKVGYKQLSLF